MIAQTIREKLEEEPFHPFIVRASSGVGYRVSNPDLVVLMRSKVFIAAPNSDKVATIPYLHITAIEESANGQSARPGRPRRGRR
jgi:hypothetical protein